MGLENILWLAVKSAGPTEQVTVVCKLFFMGLKQKISGVWKKCG